MFLRTLRERRLFDVDVEVILADDAMIESKTPVKFDAFLAATGWLSVVFGNGSPSDYGN